jgi:hypothetical protein
VRARIVGLRMEQTDIVSTPPKYLQFENGSLIPITVQFAIGSIKGDYLGPVED